MTAARIPLFRAIAWLANIRRRNALLPPRSGKAAVMLGLLVAAAAAAGPMPAAPTQGQAAAAQESLERRLGFGLFKSTFWASEDGAPSAITRIAQTPDGWIWLTSYEGLQRFDGVTFERIATPVGSPMELAKPAGFLVSKAGELWVGFTRNGGVAVFRNGRLQDMRLPHPDFATTDLVETRDGAIWAKGAKTLQRLFAGRWETTNKRLGLPQGTLTELKLGPDGTLWLSMVASNGETRLLSLSPRATHFRDSGERIGRTPGLALDRDGRLWVADQFGIRVVAERNGQRPARQIHFPAIPGQSRMYMAFDAAAGLWGTTGTQGIFYIPAAAKPGRTAEDIHRFAVPEGSTFNKTIDVFADRENNVWITTEQGLYQFRTRSALTEPAISADVSQNLWMARAADKSIYISSGAGVFHIAAGQAPRRILDEHLDSMCAARDEGIWAMNATSLLRYSGGRWQTVQDLPREKRSGDCAEDRLGRLWLAMPDGRLTWHDANGWHLSNPDMPKTPWWELVITTAGDLAYKSNKEAVRISGSRQYVNKLDPRDWDESAMIAAGLRDVFISSPAGLVRIRDGQMARIDGRRAPWVAALRWLVQTPQGETWMLRRDGFSRVMTADLDRAFDNPRLPLPRRIYDRRDGVAATQGAGQTGPQAAVDDLGRIWFLNQGGAAFIDPAQLPPVGPPPPVAIRSLTSADQTVVDPAKLTLRAGTRAIDIAYAGLSFAVPARVQFRYRLDAVDEGWVDAGTRRMASYSNLGAGNYRFQVIASNGDGIWSEPGATLEFEILPTFFESWPFRLLCGVAVLALLWLAYSLRLRAVTSQIRARMAERTAERARIARELHDTLLQSVQALTLRFQLATDYLATNEPARPVLEAAIDQADQVIAEGRDRVRDLRTFEEGDIEKVLCDIVARQAFTADVETSVTSAGTVRPLDPLAFDEIARIANEALFNIRRHADASKVIVEIEYGKVFTIRMADNGVGIDPGVLSRGGREGHFGLPGMRERARKLRGDLAIRPGVDGGTELLLTIPGRIAYKEGKFGLFARFRTTG